MKEFLAIWGAWEYQDTAKAAYDNTIIKVGTDFFLDTKNQYSAADRQSILALVPDQTWRHDEGNHIVLRLK